MEVQKDVGAHLVLAQYLYTLVSARMKKYSSGMQVHWRALAGTIAPCSLAFAALCQTGQSLLYEGCHQCSLPLCCLPACSATQHAERISEQGKMQYKRKQLLGPIMIMCNNRSGCATTARCLYAFPQRVCVRSMLSLSWSKSLMCACAANSTYPRYA